VLGGPLADVSRGKRALLVAEAYGGKLLGGLGSLLMTPFRLLPFWPKKKRLTDTYLRDPHITGLLAAAPEAALDPERANRRLRRAARRRRRLRRRRRGVPSSHVSASGFSDTSAVPNTAVAS